MEQYIPKSALVAEINKRLHQLTDAAFDSMIGRELIEIKDFLDTIEVKEVQEEPVSEDLEEAAVEWFNSVKYKSDLSGTPINAFKAGDKWQIAKLMKDATEAVVAIDSGGYPYIDKTIELYDYDKDEPLAKKGDKYKVILIKEE